MNANPKSIKDLNVTMFETLLQTLIDPTDDPAGQLPRIRQANDILMIDNNLLQLDQYAQNTHYFAYQLYKLFKAFFDELEYTDPNAMPDYISEVYNNAFSFVEMGYRNAKNIQLPPKTPASNE